MSPEGLARRHDRYQTAEISNHAASGLKTSWPAPNASWPGLSRPSPASFGTLVAKHHSFRLLVLLLMSHVPDW
jgi:hypothetical protein